MIFIDYTIVCNDLKKDRCTCHNKDYSCKGPFLPAESTMKEHSNTQVFVKVRRLPNDYPYDVKFEWFFDSFPKNPTDCTESSLVCPSTADIIPFNGFDSISGGKEFVEIEALFRNDGIEDTPEYFNLTLVNCTVVGYDQNCTEVYPYRTEITLLDPATAGFTQFEETGTFPDWVWYFLLGGIIGMGGLAYWFYTMSKNKK